MSLTKLLPKIFTTTINISRTSGSITNIGEFSDSDAVVYSGIPALVRPKTSEEVYELQGIAHRQTHAGYVDRYQNGAVLDIKVEDLVTDLTTDLKHRVIAVQHFQAANKTYASGHHIRMILENLGDPRYL
jgi:hypothetical protein